MAEDGISRLIYLFQQGMGAALQQPHKHDAQAAFPPLPVREGPRGSTWNPSSCACSQLLGGCTVVVQDLRDLRVRQACTPPQMHGFTSGTLGATHTTLGAVSSAGHPVLLHPPHWARATAHLPNLCQPAPCKAPRPRNCLHLQSCLHQALLLPDGVPLSLQGHCTVSKTRDGTVELPVPCYLDIHPAQTHTARCLTKTSTTAWMVFTRCSDSVQCRRQPEQVALTNHPPTVAWVDPPVTSALDWCQKNCHH